MGNYTRSSSNMVDRTIANFTANEGETQLETTLPIVSDGKTLSSKGVDTIEVFDVSDLTFPLASGRYILKNDITISQSITTEVGSTVYINADGGGRTITLDGVLGDLIVGNATGGVLVIENINVSITGASSTLFNTTNMIVGCAKVNFLFTGSLAQNIGSLDNSPLSISFEGCIFNGWQGGLSVDNQATRTFIDRCQFSSDLTGTGSAITIGANCPRSEIFDSFFSLANGESLFNIDSGFTGSAVIQNYTNTNPNSLSYNATGIDNTSIYVRNDQSNYIGSYVVTGNTTPTAISTIDLWVDCNFNASAIAGSNIERFTLTNTTTGELRYDGLENFSGDFIASLSVFSAGSAQEFEFRILKNGSPLPDNVILSRSISSSIGAGTLQAPIKAVTGDLFIIQVRNVDGTSDVTFKNVTTTIA
jgi:hypothetical protein